MTGPHQFLLTVVLLAITNHHCCDGGKVLFLPPTLSPSHRLPMIPWADELASRGHDVLMWAPTVMAETSYLPKKAKSDDFVIPIDNSSAIPGMLEWNLRIIWSLDWNIHGGTSEALSGYLGALEGCEWILTNAKEKIEYLLEQEWDLVVLDELFNPCGYLVSTLAKTKARAVLCTTKLTSMASHFANNPSSLAFAPNWGIFYGFTDIMTLPQRIFNVYHYNLGVLVDVGAMWLETLRLRKYYPELPYLGTSRINPDFVFVFYPRVLDFPRPLLPNIIHIGGISKIHKNSTAVEPFTEEMQSLIDRSKGFVMVALGHFAKWDLAPPATLEAFVDGFSRIPSDYAVFWQFNGENRPKNLPKNVQLHKWLPQKELLKHPKAKAFVSHCGGNSVNEAVVDGVPILAIPLFADQFDGATRLAARGAAIRLFKTSLTGQLIHESIMKLITDERYKARMNRLSEIVRDEPLSGLDTAVFWSEFAIRHHGASFMRPRSLQNLSAWRLYCLDAAAMVAVVTLVAAYLVLKVILFLWHLIISAKERDQLLMKSKKQR